jgi:1,2-phenylacetyl-CoA epoxidase catalytic subunit
MPLSDERLIALLERQGYRELVSAHLFGAGVPLAPSIDDKHMLLAHAQEELTHFEVVSGLYERLAGRSLHDAVRDRAAEVPVPVTWLEATVAGFLIDRAAASQLLEYRSADDPRLSLVVDEITEHEHEHMTAVGTSLLDLCSGKPEVPRTATAHLAKWFDIAKGLLDSPKGGDSRAATAFVDGIRPTLAACGLSLPSAPPSS